MRLAFGIGLLVLIASCTSPPFYKPEDFPPLPEVKEGDSAPHVREVLGRPDDVRNGWWVDGGVKYESDDQVWFYRGKGRVVFDGFDGRVALTQADPNQPPYATRQLSGGLYDPE